MRHCIGSRLISFAVVLILLLSAMGCGSGKPAPSAVESASEDTTEAAHTAETTAAVEVPRITTETAKVGICFARTENGDNERLLYELGKSLELQGFQAENIIVQKQTGSRSTQAEEVKECLAQGCSLIIVAPVSDDRIPSMADSITAAGASGIFVNCTPDWEELDRWESRNMPLVWIGATDEQKADCQMTILHDYSGTDRGLDFNGDGSVGAILVCEDVDTMEKLEETIDDLGSELRILREVDARNARDISLAVQETLNEFRKEAELILCSSEETAQAAADGVQLRHRLVGRDILVIGTDAHEDTCTAIINKLISGSTFTDFFEQADLTAIAGKDLIEGNQSKKQIASVVFKVTENNSQEVLDQLWDTREKVEKAKKEAEKAASEKAAAETTTESVTEAATEAAAEAATEDAAEAAAEASSEAATEASKEAASGVTAEAASEEAAKEATESLPEAATEASKEAASGATAEAASEATAKEAAESSSEASTEASSEAASGVTAEAASEAAAKEATESSSEAATEASKEAASGATVQAATEATTKEATESSSEATKESAAEAITETAEKSEDDKGGNEDKEKTDTTDRRQKLLQWLQQRMQGKDAGKER